jgi:hypothetical protein
MGVLMTVLAHAWRVEDEVEYPVGGEMPRAVI